MTNLLAKLLRLPRKVIGQARLLRADPERFARNFMEITHPAVFRDRLIDIVNPHPMHVRLDPANQGPPRLNILDSAWSMRGMTGGPNTVVNLACRVAQAGVAVRFVATSSVPEIPPEVFRRHAESLLGHSSFPEIGIESAADANRPLRVGPRDIFLATHWSTAQQLKDVLPNLPIQQFFYMLQEFEPGFYAWSSNFALAVETYGLDFWPIVNEQLLADFLFALPFGRLSDPVTRERALVFEPAVDAALFNPGSPTARRGPRRLLFYARPTNTRNMFGLGFKALEAVSADPTFAGWEFISIGSRDGLPDMSLGGGRVLKRAPWMDYAGYANYLRDADILLCPMISPHTSYPVLEMVACGGLSVTNTFATKTSAALESISPNIVSVEPTIAGFREGLLSAARRVAARDSDSRPPILNAHRDWESALAPVATRVAALCETLAREAVPK